MKNINPIFHIYSKLIFYIAAIFVVINSITIANEVTNQTIDQLSKYGTEALAFQISYISLAKELIPLNIELILSWLLVIECQYKMKTKTKDHFPDVQSHIFLFMLLLIVGLAISLSLAYFKTITWLQTFSINIEEIIIVTLKVFFFAFSLNFWRKFQKKFINQNWHMFPTAFFCLAIIIASFGSIFFLNYTINQIIKST